jgi:hypothetical protein
MTKRAGVYLRFALFFVLALLATGVAGAQSSRTFYIDYAAGSNSNPGTSEGAPWKTHPLMQHGGSCDSGAPTYAHQAGDHFIFKGGVTWPAACFQIFIGSSSGGAVGNPDYYGVCLSNADYAVLYPKNPLSANLSPCASGTSWPSSGWTRPLWDFNFLNPASGNHAVQTSGSGNFSAGVPYLTFDNLEIARLNTYPSVGDLTTSAVLALGGSQSNHASVGVTVANCYLHDWVSTTNQVFNNTLLSYGSIYGASLVEYTETSDANGYYYIGGVQHFEVSSGGCAGCGEVKYSKFHDGWIGCSSVTSCHDNEFYNIQGGTDVGIHTHMIYEDAAFQTAVYAYNNYLHDSQPGLAIQMFYYSNIFNNTLVNLSQNAIYLAQCEPGEGTAPCGDNSSRVGYVANNIILLNSGSACYVWYVGPDGSGNTSGTGLGTIYFDNNICLTGSGGGSVGGFSVATIHTTKNYTMLSPEATTFGYTSTNKMVPTSSDSNTIGVGGNHTPLCIGELANACKDASGALWIGRSYISRAAIGTSPWNLGPVELSSGPIDSPSPTSLTFGTQTTGTSSSPQVSTLTNTGSATDAISAISVTGTNSSQFTQTNDCPPALSAGASCHISVTFSPTVAGSLSANVSITDTVNPSGAAIVSLTGTGQAPGLWTFTQAAPYVESPGSATCVLTLPANPATGSTVVIGAVPGPNSGDTLTAVDANGNSYTLSANSPSPTLTGAGRAYVFYIASAPSNASKTVTITDATASPSYFDCGGANFQVVSGYTPSFDADAAAMSASANPLNVPSLTPSAAQEALFFEATPGNYFSALGAPWTTNTILVPNTGAPHWGTSDGYVVNQTSAANPNLTSVSPGGGSAIIAAFKATAAGSTPTITSLSIVSGNEGASVTITGTNFGASQGTSTVQINATLVTCGTWSATSLVCTIPTPATTGGISVTTSDGTSNSLTFTVTPHLTSLSVTTGIVGTSVTATGTGFGATQGTSTFTFNGTACSASSWSDSSATCAVPAAATTGNVNITQGGNASNSISFTVTPNISLLNPTSGVVGTGVTITGTTFGATQGSSTVKFNGTAATCTSWSSTSLSCSVPSATTGNVVVNVSGNNSNGISFTVNSPVSTPVIASVTPNVGLAGTTVTITGSNFGSSQGTSTVSFNGVIAAVSSWSATSITCLSPAGATTGNILVTVSGSASNPVPYGVYQFPTITIR